MIQNQRKIILIFGRTGSGKTTLAKKLSESYERLVIIDALSEYDNGLIIFNFSDFIDFFINNKPEKFRIICRFSSDEEIDYLFRAIFEIGNLCLLVEESEIYISPYSRSSSFLRLVRYGRHRNISIIAVARRVVELSNDIRAQVNDMYSFKQIHIRDIQHLTDLGFQKVQNLADYEYELVQF